MEYDVVIIGAGPAGYVAAIRASQLGMKTALVEAQKLGGMCLNWGCIPTKSLLESAKRYTQAKKLSTFGIDGIDKRKLSFNFTQAKKRAQTVVRRLTNGVDYLLRKNKVDLIVGQASIENNHAVAINHDRLLETSHIVIATGSKPEKIVPPLDHGFVTELNQLMSLESIPDNVVVYGKGPHAIELVQFFSMIEKTVTLLTPDSDLVPGFDQYLVDFINKKLKQAKIAVFSNTPITSVDDHEIKVEDEIIPYELLINASLRQGIIPDSQVEIAVEHSFIQVNDHFQTNIPSIFAIGDVNGNSFLAHAASAQGLHVINFINGIQEEFNLTKIPLNLYTAPEIAQHGLTEKQLIEQDITYKVSEFPLSANGKAMIEDQGEGVVRLLSETKYGEVLGAQIIAQNATDMIAEAATLMQLEGTIYDIAKVIHAHPTVSEVFMEAGFAAMDQPLHK